MISLIIPTLRVENLIDKCIASFEGQYDELIVIDDKEKSLAEKINTGLRSAKGDYLIVSNDDVEANKGTLKDLCYEDKVVSPTVNGGVFKVFHAHLYALPRKVYAMVGQMDETCPGPYHIDADYWLRLINAGYEPVINDSVDVYHNHPGSTMQTLNVNMGDTRQWFINKWGQDQCRRVGA